ncbi:MAG: ABC transporter substrate-binding protein [Deltaproteobacteria bacterium]|nr:ABC transporter substrate-binding protein [Deltaproteobacteria bacterium]
MALAKLKVMYGHLEGTERKFARDPSGYLSIEKGFYRKHGLEISWEHVQGTEERYRSLASGDAQISFVVGRASLQHYLATKRTRILGCAMNSCPYFLVVRADITSLDRLEGRAVACREEPGRSAPLAETFQALAGLTIGRNLTLELPASDQRAFEMLRNGNVHAALLPRPYAFMAEEKNFHRIPDWPDVVDDPLPITIETSVVLREKYDKEFTAFLAAHREGIRYLQGHPDEATTLLRKQFGHPPAFTAKTIKDYLVFMNESLTVDFKQLEKILSQVAPETSDGARRVASEWVVGGALRG